MLDESNEDDLVSLRVPSDKDFLTQFVHRHWRFAVCDFECHMFIAADRFAGAETDHDPGQHALLQQEKCDSNSGRYYNYNRRPRDHRPRHQLVLCQILGRSLRNDLWVYSHVCSEPLLPVECEAR